MPFVLVKYNPVIEVETGHAANTIQRNVADTRVGELLVYLMENCKCRLIFLDVMRLGEFILRV